MIEFFKYSFVVTDVLFSEFKWYRKFKGGHWEQWYIGKPVFSHVWLQKDHGARPAGACTHCSCEEYNLIYEPNHPYR